MTVDCPTWPCRHDPPCYSEGQHWEVSGFDYPDDMLNDPVCRDCGWPGGSCMCYDDYDERHDAGVLVRDEIVVKQKPGHVVAQVSEESLRTLRQFVEKCTCMCPYATKAKQVLARDLAAVLKETP